MENKFLLTPGPLHMLLLLPETLLPFPHTYHWPAPPRPLNLGFYATSSGSPLLDPAVGCTGSSVMSFQSAPPGSTPRAGARAEVLGAAHLDGDPASARLHVLPRSHRWRLSQLRHKPRPA